MSPDERARLRAELRAKATAGPPPARLSLYFFASADSMPADRYYDLVLRAAEHADRAGLHAVWLPERHFVDFGGFSPNPAVLAAAVAARTRRLRVHAGSVAAPLHHPVRIAEDWALVDNLSGGRVGVSFASGWHRDDFVLAREDFERRRVVTSETVERVRSLWRGEVSRLPTTAGGVAEVRLSPRPVQPELPVWLTAAGNPATFAEAGRLGTGVMTALLGQTLPALRDNVARYRAAWREGGHAGRGDVVVMVHAHVSDRPDLEDRLRPAMHRYLAAFRRQTGGAADEVLLEEAFRSYLRGPLSLLGGPDKARSVLAGLAAADVDEVGCLVDFGLPADEVLAGLPALTALVGGAA
ncbi:LLM class flavin-dependent oxidoreductase [Saccharothrix sp. SC076]|nr:LLM class flavin-dependent oxidoreductase [Saccharothrix obliqua]